MRSGPEFPEWQAYLEYLDGSTLPEYQITCLPSQGDQPPTALCYVACQEDKEFRTVARACGQVARSVHISVSFRVDGVQLRSICSEGLDGLTITKECTRQRGLDGEVVEANLKFGKLLHIEDDEGDRAQADEMGQIEVCLYTGYRHSPKIGPVPTAQTLQSTINEKAKKALIGHSVQLGTYTFLYESQLKDKTWKFDKDTPKCPQYKFVFRYRSEGLLRAQGIFSPPPSTGTTPPRQTKRARLELKPDDIKPQPVVKAESSGIGNTTHRQRDDTVESSKDDGADGEDDDVVFLRQLLPGKRGKRGTIPLENIIDLVNVRRRDH